MPSHTLLYLATSVSIRDIRGEAQVDNSLGLGVSQGKVIGLPCRDRLSEYMIMPAEPTLLSDLQWKEAFVTVNNSIVTLGEIWVASLFSFRLISSFLLLHKNVYIGVDGDVTIAMICAQQSRIHGTAVHVVLHHSCTDAWELSCP